MSLYNDISVLCIGRLAATASARNKPTLVVSTTYELWIGNESHDDIEISGDIMGFHKGDWEERVVSGHLAGDTCFLYVVCCYQLVIVSGDLDFYCCCCCCGCGRGRFRFFDQSGSLHLDISTYQLPSTVTLTTS